MAKLNTPRTAVYTAPGAKAKHINAELQLRRSVMACLLWEKAFYEDGQSIADRIVAIIPKVDPHKVADIAVEAREDMKLRHAPLLIVREMARLNTHKHLVRDTLARIIQRPDELNEFLAIYWKDGKQPLSAQVKKGLADAFKKFNAYQLAKWNKTDAEIKLRDVLFLCHAKPDNKEQEEMWEKLINGTLETPDTWEVSLSGGGNKKDHWERLLSENKLGALSLLRNLRNFTRDDVNRKLIVDALDKMNTKRVLPFRFITAAKYAPALEPHLEKTLFKCASEQEKLPGKTVLIVDVSGSMYGVKVSRKSEVTRAEVACSLAVLVREMCEDPRIYATAGNDMKRVHKTEVVPPRRGFALSDAIYNMCRPLGGGGIFLKQVMDYVREKEKDADRVIVITDEQDCDVSHMRSPDKADTTWGKNNYMINVSVERNGIGYGNWVHIDGWSEAVINYIIAVESFSDYLQN